MDTYTLKAVLSAVDRLSPVLKNVNVAAAATRKYLGDLGNSVNGLATKFGIPLGIISTISAGFGIAAIKKAVVGFTEMAEEVQKGAFKAGMSNAQFQRMKYVAEQAALPIESLQIAMGKLNKNISAAASGKNDDLVALFKQLHIPLRTANGQIRNAADMLPQLADAFVKNQSPVKQAAIGVAAFGKAYQEMLPMLNEGSEGIEKSLARFAKLRGVVSDDDIAGAKEFGDKLTDLNAVAKGFQMTIAKELVPVLSPMLEQFIQWAAANKKLIGGEVKKVVQDLVATIRQVDWLGLVKGIGSFIDSLKTAVDGVGGIRNALILLALLMNAQTISAVVGLAGSLLRLGWVAGVAVFGKLGLLATANLWLGASFVWMRGRAIAAMLAMRIGGIGSLWSVIGAAVTGVGTAVAAVGAYLVTAARAALLFGRALLLSPLGIVLAIATAAFLIYENWDTLKGWFASFVDWIGGLWGKLTGIVMGLGGVAQLLTSAWEPLKAWFASLFDWMGDKFGWVAQLAGGIGRAVGSIFSTGGPQASSVESARLAASPDASRPGGLGSGSMNLSASQTVGGNILVTFKDAPKGMQVEEVRSNNPRVPVSTSVGYRTLGTDYGF